MTSIKPPLGPPTAAPLPDALVDAIGSSTAPAAAATDSAASSTAAAQTSSVQAAAVADAGANDALAALAAAVGRGELSVTQALDQVVQGAVGSLSAQLSDADLADLTAVLQHALAHDPTFAALRDAQD